MTEVLWRLIEPEDIVLDIGANIGYTVSIAMKKLQNEGKLYCFEPNPEVYDELIKNINVWQKDCQCGVFPENIALSNENKEGTLNVPLKNRGEAFISHQEFTRDEILKTFTVKMMRLDDLIDPSFKIGIIKLDVEGYELQVLHGVSQILERKIVRDIIFEEHRGYPTPVTTFLESYGYSVFKIWKGFWKPTLADAKKLLSHPWEPPNYLATLDPDRAIKLLNPYGWQSLHQAKTFLS